MKMYTRALPLLLIIGVSLASCKKDFELFIPQPPETSAPGALRQGDVAGTVHTPDGKPLAAATVRVPGGPAALTNAEGVFRIREVAFTERYFPITIAHPDYLPRTVFAGSSAEGLALAEVTLLEGEEAHDFHSSNGVEAALADGTVVLPPAALVTESGAVFSGQARLLHAAWTAGEALDGWPLPLAQTSQGLQFVVPAGMWALVLETMDGAPLALRTGFGMQVRLSPNDARPLPPHEGLILWHFDPDSGFWQEAATATVEGGYVRAELPATGYWMVGQALPATWLAGKVQTPEMVPLPHMRLEVALPDGLVIGRLTTQSDGSFVAYVPAGELLQLTCTDACGQVLYQSTAGPLQSPTRLAPFAASAPSDRYVQGRLHDCEGLARGAAVRIAEPDRISWLQSGPEGLFRGFAAKCQETWVEVQAVDAAHGRMSEPVVLEWTDEIALPPLTLCLDEEEDFAIAGLDGLRQRLVAWTMASDDGSWHLTGIAESGEYLSITAGMVMHEGVYDLSGYTAGLGSMGAVVVQQGQLVIREWSTVPGGRVSGYWWAKLRIDGKDYRYTGSFRTRL